MYPSVPGQSTPGRPRAGTQQMSDRSTARRGHRLMIAIFVAMLATASPPTILGYATNFDVSNGGREPVADHGP